MKNAKTKKLTVLLLSVALVLTALAGCAKETAPAEPSVPESLSAPLNIGTLMGPTGMGMADMISDDISFLNVTVYDSPDQCMAGLLNGELDIAAIPSNVAAVLYNKTEGGVKLLGVNTGGVLYLLSNGADPVSSLEDLKGKTVYASGMGGVPEYAFKGNRDRLKALVTELYTLYPDIDGIAFSIRTHTLPAGGNAQQVGSKLIYGFSEPVVREQEMLL